jgi:hypothetical protein
MGFKPFGIPLTLLAMIGAGARLVEYDKEYPSGNIYTKVKKGDSEYKHAEKLCDKKSRFTQRAYSKKNKCYYRDVGRDYILKFDHLSHQKQCGSPYANCQIL